MLLLTYANLETCFSGMIVPRRAQWTKKVRARQQMTVPMARGHGLEKGLPITHRHLTFSLKSNQGYQAQGFRGYRGYQGYQAQGYQDYQDRLSFRSS